MKRQGTWAIVAALGFAGLSAWATFGQAGHVAGRKCVGIEATAFRDSVFLFRAWDDGTVDVIMPNLGSADNAPQTWTDPTDAGDPTTYVRAPRVPATAPNARTPVPRR